MNNEKPERRGGVGSARALLVLLPLIADVACAKPLLLDEAQSATRDAACSPSACDSQSASGSAASAVALPAGEQLALSRCELAPGTALELRSIRIRRYAGAGQPEGVQDAFVLCAELAVVNRSACDVTMRTESSMVRPFTLAQSRLLRAGDGAEVRSEPYPLEGNSGQYSCRIAPGTASAGEVDSSAYRFVNLEERFDLEIFGTITLDGKDYAYRLRVPVCPGELLRSAETLAAAVHGGRKEDAPLQGGDVATLRACLAAGADVRSCVDARGRSLLHLAAEGKGSAMTELLLAAGADPDARDSRGYTPLHTAAEQDAAEVVRLLAKAGADLSARTPDRLLTPLHVAAWLGNTEAVRALLAAGAPVQACKEEGERGSATPLHLAAAWGHEDIVELLLAAGADPEERVLFGRERLTPRECALRSGREGCDACVRLLEAAEKP